MYRARSADLTEPRPGAISEGLVLRDRVGGGREFQTDAREVWGQHFQNLQNRLSGRMSL